MTDKQLAELNRYQALCGYNVRLVEYNEGGRIMVILVGRAVGVVPTW